MINNWFNVVAGWRGIIEHEVDAHGAHEFGVVEGEREWRYYLHCGDREVMGARLRVKARPLPEVLGSLFGGTPRFPIEGSPNRPRETFELQPNYVTRPALFLDQCPVESDDDHDQ